jgi:tape measure domain-containing protein
MEGGYRIVSHKTIDERVVEMRFDNQQFEKNVQESLSTLDKLKKALRLDGAAKSFEKLERSSNRFGMNGLSGAVDTVRAKFSALEVVGVTALANITNSAVNTGKQIVKALTIDPIKSGFQEYETQINAVQTILANTSSKGTTLEQVNAALDELNHYADMTIYNFTEMTRNIGTFTAAGVDLETSVSAIKGIANLAAVSGSTSQQASTAMYQLSQALAAGTVKLMDWNSVVNAGMGGQVFQDALMDTARVHGIAIDQMIKDEGSFRETLSKGWLSSDILTETLQKFTGDLSRAQLVEQGYTEQQIDAIMEMGQTANDAATKVKTFTQLVDTLKEAAQSGWTETWETIVGDFEEAKGLWTKISDELSEMIGASANARNELVSGALDSGWSNFLKEGITDAVGFKECIVSAAKAHGVAIEEMAQGTEKFEDSLNQGWLTADILSEALTDLTQKTAGLSDAELVQLGMTREQVDDLEKLNQAVRDGTVNLDEYASKIARMSGRDNLIESFWNTWEALFAIPKQAGDVVGVITTVKNAFRDIFPRTTSEQLYAFTEGLRKFTEKFKMTGETADKLRRSFKGLFAVMDIITSFVKAGVKTSFSLLSSVLGGVDLHILDITASIGDALVGFRDWIKEDNIFVNALTFTANGLKLAIRLVREWIGQFKSMPQVQERIAKVQSMFSGAMSGIGEYFAGGLKRINEFIERVQALDSISLSNLGDILQDFRDNVLGYFVTLGGRFNSLGDILNTFKGKVLECLTGIRGGFDNLGDVLKAMESHIGGYFSGLTSHLDGLLKKLVDFVVKLRGKISDNIGMGEILTVGIGAGLIVTVKKLGDALEILAGPFKAFSDIAGGLSDILDGCSNVLNAFAAEVKSKSLVNISKAIAILVGSLAVLTMLDTERLMGAIATLGALAAGLVAVSAAMGVIEKLGDFKKVSVSFTGLAAALLILVVSLKKMEELNRDAVWGNLGILALLTAGLSAAAIVMSRAAPQLTQGSIFILAFASSLRILIGAMKGLEDLNISRSGGSIPLLIAAVAGLTAVARACGNLRMGSAAGILAISVSLGILVGVFRKVAAMDMSKVQGSLGAFVTIIGTFAGIMAASHLAGANAAKAGVSILAMSAALLLIVPAIKGLAKISPLDMERASDAISKLLLVFAAVTAASYFAGANAAKAGAMLLMMSGALVILSGVMVLLSHLEPDGLDQALTAIIKLEAAFGALIVATHWAGDVKGTLTLLAVSVGLLAVAIGALSLIDQGNLRSASTSLSLVIGALSLVIASTGVAKKATSTIVTMTLAVGALAGILALLSLVDAQNNIKNATALSELLLALSASMVIASKVQPMSANAFAAIGVMTLVTAALAGIVGLMSYLNVEASLKTAASLSILLLSMSGACLILSGVGSTGSAAFVGIGALVTLIAAVGGLMAGIGALAEYFPSLEGFLDHGLVLLEKIGFGLGSFAGNIIGGFLAGTTSGLPEIGENLSAFMESAKPFFDNVKGIDASAMTGVEAIAGTILMLSTADILNSLTSWITGGASLTTFGEQLKEFGSSFKSYAEEVQGIENMDVVSASANAAKSLAEFASAIPNSGGLIGKLAGENSLSVFAAELEDFGPKFAKYAESIADIDPETVTASASAAKSLAEFANNLPNSGGLAEFFSGNNNLDKFGEMLDSFGNSFKNYYNSIGDPEKVNAATAGLQALIDVAKGVGNGDTIKDFGSFLAGLAETRLDDFINAFTNSEAEVRKAGQSLGRNLENGIRASIDGLRKAGQDAAQGFVNGIKSKLGSVSSAGASLGNTAIQSARKALDSHSPSKKFKKIGKDTVKGLAIGVTENSGIVDNAISGIVNSAKSKAEKLTDVDIDKWIGKASSAVKAEAQSFQNAAQEAKKSSKSVSTAVKGLAIGVTENSGIVDNAISGIVDSAKSKAEELTDVDIDKWIGKASSAIKAEAQSFQNAAQEAKKSSKSVSTAAKKTSKAQKTAVKSAYETFEEYMEEERFYNRLSTEEQLNQYKKVLDTYKLSAEERKKAKREVYTLENQLQDETYQASIDWIEEEKYYNRLSLEEELAAWEKVQSKYLEGTEERKKADREVYRLRNELASASYENSMNWIEQEKYYNRMTLSDELAAYLRMQSRYAKGTEERKKLDREVYRLQKEIADAQKQYYSDVQQIQAEASQKRLDLEQQYADKVKAINDQLARDIQAANDEYENAVKSRENTLYRSYGLFDKAADRKDISGSELMANLEGQVKEFGAWQDTLDSLSARGLDDELIAELEEMGPSAISEIKALNSMTDSELKKYAALWSIRHAQAREQAASELEDLRIETQNKIELLRIESAQELDEYRSMWSQEMDELNNETNQKLDDLRKDFGETVGLIKKDTESELREMTESANSILRQAGWDETGKQIVNGLTGGVESQKPSFLSVLKNMAMAGVNAVKNILGIHSPSRVFGEIGNYAGLGFVNALLTYADRSYDAGLQMADAAKDGLANSIQRIADVVNSDIDPEPVIRPVVDLSDVTRGAGEINGLFGSGRSIDLAWRASAGINASISEGKSGITVQNDDVVAELRSLRGEMSAMTERLERMQVVLDTGALVGGMAGPMDAALGQMAIRKGRGN